jgi:hypothetical protein
MRLKKFFELIKKEREKFGVITTGSGWLYRYDRIPEALRNLEIIKKELKESGKLWKLEYFSAVPAQDTVSEIANISNLKDISNDDYFIIISDDFHLDRIKK